jgi:uncharacterized protein YjiS (DUF1127 family)
MAYSTTYPTAADREAKTAGGLLAQLKQRFANYRRYRETLAELNELSPRDLADLGLSEGDLHSVAWDSVYGTA